MQREAPSSQTHLRKLSCRRVRRYTYGTTAVTENRTFVNIKEREGFIIEPFTASIATAAVAYTLNRDDYVFDAAYDVNRNAAFLSAGKRFDEKTAAKVRRDL